MNCIYVSKYIFTGTPLEFARQCHIKEMAAFLVSKKIYPFAWQRQENDKQNTDSKKKISSFFQNIFTI